MSLLPILNGNLQVSGAETAADVTAVVCNARTGAHGEYTNYAFNSLAVIGGVAYGCRSTGVFELAGDTDAGTDITASCLTGLTDFGDERAPDRAQRLKRVDSVVTLSRSRRALTVHVCADERREYRYDQPGSTEEFMTPKRSKVGRGLEARSWQFGISNSDGCDFEIAEIDPQHVVLSRRV